VGQLFVARLVPVRDFFTFSGHTALVKPEARATVLGHFRRHGVRIANPRRFVPTPGSPAPSPRDPCPCGSGRPLQEVLHAALNCRGGDGDGT